MASTSTFMTLCIGRIPKSGKHNNTKNRSLKNYDQEVFLGKLSKVGWGKYNSSCVNDYSLRVS